MVRRSKHLASISLGVMGIGFFSTLPLPTTIFSSLLHGGFEAGLVGGLADWFAVTALFRHPLGIPIPHTALLPKNREKVSEGIIYMIENDWLSKESVTEKINKLSFTEKIVPLIENELQSSQTCEGISTFIVELINNVDEKQLAEVLTKELKTYLFRIDVHNILKVILESFLEHQYEEKSFDYILGKIQHWVENEENRNKLGAASLKALGNLKLDGLLQFAVQSLLNMVSEERMGQIISSVVIKAVENLQTSENTLRKDLISLIRSELNHVAKNQKVIQELEIWKVNWLNNHDLTPTISLLLTEIKQKWIRSLRDSDNVNQYIIPFLLRIVDRVKSNEHLIGRLDMWLHKKVIDFIDENHSRIGKLVRENLNKLDNETLTQLIEERVGKDLQWIRVNGAVCGFIIGIILSVIKLI